MKRSICVPAWIATSAIALSVSLHAQQPPAGTPTLHASARLVPITASVRDKNGITTADLTKDDFVLKQDGKEEPIRYFSAAGESPLSFAVLVDVSASQRDMIPDEVKASDLFFESMLRRPQDRAMLVQFDSKIQQLKAFTNDYGQLHNAVQYIKSPTEAKSGTRLIDAVAAVSEKILAPETGRKAIILITDGGDTGGLVTLQRAIQEAQTDDVAIYSICYRASDAGLPGAPAQIANIMIDHSNEILKELAIETGGETFRVTRKMTLHEIFDQIADILKKQYQIGYIPPTDTATNRTHKLQLKTNDPHMKVQARTGFFAAP